MRTFLLCMICNRVTFDLATRHAVFLGIFGACAHGTAGWTESCPGPVSLKTGHLALSRAAEAEPYIVVAVGRVVVVAIGYPQVVGIVVPAAAAIDPVGACAGS